MIGGGAGYVCHTLLGTGCGALYKANPPIFLPSPELYLSPLNESGLLSHYSIHNLEVVERYNLDLSKKNRSITAVQTVLNQRIG